MSKQTFAQVLLLALWLISASLAFCCVFVDMNQAKLTQATSAAAFFGIVAAVATAAYFVFSEE